MLTFKIVRSCFAGMTPAKRTVKALAALEAVEQQHKALARATMYRMDRQDLLRKIAQYAHHGKIAVFVWSRDCDMCSGTTRHVIEAKAGEFDALVNRVMTNAEGPTYISVVAWNTETPDDFRDGILEAYEDGHPHCVY